jgi:hypothetical protein
VQRWFLSEVIEYGFDASWLGWWENWVTVRDLELHGLGERRGQQFVNRDHIDRLGRPWNRTVAWVYLYSARSPTLLLSFSYSLSHLVHP